MSRPGESEATPSDVAAPLRARYYRSARTAHLERLAEELPGDFFYRKRMYDFDPERAPAGAVVVKTSLLQILGSVWRKRYDVLEIVEPYAPSALFENLLICAVTRLSRWTPGRPTQLVAYAIENADLPRKYSRELHVPHILMTLMLRTAVGFCYRTFTKLAFGTVDAEANYHRLLGRSQRNLRGPLTTCIPGLPSSKLQGADSGCSRRGHQVVFLGAFDERKGVLQLLEAWPNVLERLPDASLLIMGKGPLESTVTRMARDARSVSVWIDPPRPSIWAALRSSTVLCLLSQPRPGWKEQIGLPIVEGLGLGLEIVTTRETGLSEWLAAHGHRVVNYDAPPAEISEQICFALSSARAPELIVADLPARDGRLEADRWLHEGVE